ncbi:hypothetical protein ACKXGF_12060 [Alkalibacillus sp. S2W]|uniref:hypothetical protein n=1 Tax=Alkalibacillus sp. S2W TaxID=3386553 RepID=UPI00398CE4CD
MIDLVETAQVVKDDWYDILYRHYEKLGYTEQQRHLAKNLLCEFGMTYYDYLRKLYPNDEWTLVVKSLIDDEAHRFRGEHYAQFLLKEQQYDYLLAYCQDYPNSIRNFAPYLKDAYPKEVRTLFETLINQEADKASDRKAYRRVCKTINDMQKICGYNETLPIIEKLEREYYRRPAFLDELSRVKI